MLFGARTVSKSPFAQAQIHVEQRTVNPLLDANAINRLQQAVTGLQAGRTNLSAALSRIRDVDVASEAAELTRLGILQQAGAAVLAQANQQPSLALSLLR